MSAPSRTLSDSSQHSDTLRKRVGKACDRCRLKKSKCDGTSPCSRCRADNAICVFGERKKAHDKVYPKGYVEMLEQQQAQLVAGLQETYKRLLDANLWPGQPLDENEGHPLTHDILTTLDIVHAKPDGSLDMFEEDTDKLQQRLVAHGAPFIHRRGSFSSDSDHSVTHSHTNTHKRPRSIADSPVDSPISTTYRKSLDIERPRRSPKAQSPKSIPSHLHNPHKPSPLHTESPAVDNFQNVEEDALMSSFPWEDLPAPDGLSDEPQFTFPQTNAFGNLDAWPGMDSTATFNQNFMNPFGVQPNFDFTNLQQLQKEPMDMDLNGFVPVVS